MTKYVPKYRIVVYPPVRDAQDEAEAVAEIRQDWHGYRSRYWDDPARMYASDYAESTAKGRAAILDYLLSKAGASKLHWDSLALISCNLMRRRQYIPARLADWTAGVLGRVLDRAPAGRPRTGPNKDTLLRDAAIWLAMYDWHKCWTPVCVTDNRNGDRRTALSELVAEAILGNRAQYKTVEGVWTKENARHTNQSRPKNMG